MYQGLAAEDGEYVRSTSGLGRARTRTDSLSKGDDQWKAILWTNIFAITSVVLNAIVKIIHGQGVSIGWISLNRNLLLPFLALTVLRRNPFNEFPYRKKVPLFWRITSGQLNFAVMNAAVVFLPLSIFTIISKTTPFWTAILGFFIMAEAILPIEIGGMMVCFGAILEFSRLDFYRIPTDNKF